MTLSLYDNFMYKYVQISFDVWVYKLFYSKTHAWSCTFAAQMFHECAAVNTEREKHMLPSPSGQGQMSCPQRYHILTSLNMFWDDARCICWNKGPCYKNQYSVESHQWHRNKHESLTIHPWCSANQGHWLPAKRHQKNTYLPIWRDITWREFWLCKIHDRENSPFINSNSCPNWAYHANKDLHEGPNMQTNKRINKLIYIYGCFQKKGYPQVINFNRIFHYKPSILGYPYFWKHPYIFYNPLAYKSSLNVSQS